jgi:hypothetical protein
LAANDWVSPSARTTPFGDSEMLCSSPFTVIASGADVVPLAGSTAVRCAMPPDTPRTVRWSTTSSTLGSSDTSW